MNNPCINCGGVLKKNAKKYCSHKCQQVFQNREYISNWKAGLEKGVSVRGVVSKHIRAYLLSETGGTCQKCGYQKVHSVTGNFIVEINHIDGDAYNTTPDNLEVLCPNCHAETFNYGSLNRGRGRKRRYK